MVVVVVVVVVVEDSGREVESQQHCTAQHRTARTYLGLAFGVEKDQASIHLYPTYLRNLI